MSSILEAARRADRFFMNQSPIHAAMRRLAKTLGDMQIPFAIAGAMAANAHGHRRTTADVDILIRQEDLDRFKAEHLGRGYLNKFEGSKNFRDTIAEVDIDALIAGKYPGDGQEKPVVFPNPEDVVFIGPEEIPYLHLETLLELKLASGMTAPHRMQDLADVIQLIKANQLDEAYATKLNPYVSDKFHEMVRASRIQDDY